MAQSHNQIINDIDIAVDKARNDNQPVINDEGYLQPRPITERLMRRIVAKLLNRRQMQS